MFKVSQEIHLNTNATKSKTPTTTTMSNTIGGTRPTSGNLRHGFNNNINNNNNNSSHQNQSNDNESDCVFGRYQRTPDTDSYPTMEHQVFVAPELTDSSKVQLLHFPSNAVRLNSQVRFIIKRNGVKGNFEVKAESPSGIIKLLAMQILDPERFQVEFTVNEAGLYKVHIKCNCVALPKSPFIIVCISGEAENTTNTSKQLNMPIFDSDASKVVVRGLGLTHLMLNERNEFTVDGSEAGNNILFVGICGPKGQCDEVVIKHFGRNIYKVSYQMQDAGDYLVAAKWGDEHIPGSPFHLSSI